MDQLHTTRKISVVGEIAKYVISACILGSGILTAAWMIYQKKKPEKMPSDALIPMVSTFDAYLYDGPLDMIVSGSVVPYREIKVAAEVGGRIVRKFPECEAGTYVTKGTPLIEIDPSDYQMELDTTESEIVQAQKSLEETEEEIRGAIKNLELAQTDSKLQEKEFNRIKAIGSSLSVSEVDQAERAFLQAQTTLTGRRNSLDMLKARKSRMEAALNVSRTRNKKALTNLARTTIEALEDGIIVRESVEQGDYVQKGTQLFLLEDTSQSEVRCNLTPTELAWIRANSYTGGPFTEVNNLSVYRLPRTRVAVFEKPNPENEWQGTLERFDGIGRDELTKTIPCRIVIDSPILQTDNGPYALVRGMYVKCRIEIPRSQVSAEQLLAFPTVALQPGGYIWIARDKKLKKMPVKIIDHTSTEIDGKRYDVAVIDPEKTDFKVGDAVIVSPIPHPTEGATIILHAEEKSVPAEEDSAQPKKDAAELSVAEPNRARRIDS